MPAVYQILISLGALLFFVMRYSEYRRGKRGFFDMISITLFWAGLLFFAWFPSYIRWFAQVTGIRGELNALFALSLFFLFFFQVKILLKIDYEQSERIRFIRSEAKDRFFAQYPGTTGE